MQSTAARFRMRAARSCAIFLMSNFVVFPGLLVAHCVLGDVPVYLATGSIACSIIFFIAVRLALHYRTVNLSKVSLGRACANEWYHLPGLTLMMCFPEQIVDLVVTFDQVSTFLVPVVIHKASFPRSLSAPTPRLLKFYSS
jgi:hypothetical protein